MVGTSCSKVLSQGCPRSRAGACWVDKGPRSPRASTAHGTLQDSDTGEERPHLHRCEPLSLQHLQELRTGREADGENQGSEITQTWALLGTRDWGARECPRRSCSPEPYSQEVGEAGGMKLGGGGQEGPTLAQEMISSCGSGLCSPNRNSLWSKQAYSAADLRMDPGLHYPLHPWWL